MITDELLRSLGIPEHEIPEFLMFLQEKGITHYVEIDKSFHSYTGFDDKEQYSLSLLLGEFHALGEKREVNLDFLCGLGVPKELAFDFLKFLLKTGYTGYSKCKKLFVNRISDDPQKPELSLAELICKFNEKPINNSNCVIENGTGLPYKNMNMREFACLKLRLPESGTPWLDELIQHHRTKKQVEKLKFYSKSDQVSGTTDVDRSHVNPTTSTGFTETNIIPEPSPVETHTTGDHSTVRTVSGSKPEESGPVETHTTSQNCFVRYSVAHNGSIYSKIEQSPCLTKNTFLSEKLAMKARAMSILGDAIEFENKGWEPDWNNPDQIKIVITVSNNRICIGSTIHKNHFLAFEEIEKAQRVFVSFRNEILDYYMVDEKDRQQ